MAMNLCTIVRGSLVGLGGVEMGGVKEINFVRMTDDSGK